MDGLAPGTYTIEAWGRPKAGGNSQRYFTRTIQVATTSPVIEYYAPSTKHYFMSAGPGDIAALDPGTVGWLRSGQQWKAWLRAQDAPAGAMPVCRFYAAGPNSHFYTASPSDCQGLKDLETQQRAQAAAAGQPFLGWQYEQVAFYALVPTNGQCPGDTVPVYRAYNNRFAENDSNHRFMADPVMRSAEMSLGWSNEGVVVLLAALSGWMIARNAASSARSPRGRAHAAARIALAPGDRIEHARVHVALAADRRRGCRAGARLRARRRRRA